MIQAPVVLDGSWAQFRSGHQGRSRNKLERVEEGGLVGAGDQLVLGVDIPIAVEVVGKVDGGGVDQPVPRVGAGQEFVLGRHLRVGGVVASLAYGVAEVED